LSAMSLEDRGAVLVSMYGGNLAAALDATITPR